MKKRVASSPMILPSAKSFVAMRAMDYIMCFYGPPGVGKTTLADKMSDKTFFISTDRGTRFFRALREEVHNYTELLAVVRALEAGQAKKYEIVCLDHIDDISNMIEAATCKKLGIEDLGDLEWSKGYRQFKKDLWDFMQRLLTLTTGLVFIAHENIRSVQKTAIRKTDKIMPDMGKSAWKVLLPKCDLVGYCGYGKDDVRILRTAGTGHIYAKDRTRRVKPSNGCEPLDGKKFISTFRKA